MVVLFVISLEEIVAQFQSSAEDWLPFKRVKGEMIYDCLSAKMHPAYEINKKIVWRRNLYRAKNIGLWSSLQCQVSCLQFTIGSLWNDFTVFTGRDMPIGKHSIVTCYA